MKKDVDDFHCCSIVSETAADQIDNKLNIDNIRRKKYPIQRDNCKHGIDIVNLGLDNLYFVLSICSRLLIYRLNRSAMKMTFFYLFILCLNRKKLGKEISLLTL